MTSKLLLTFLSASAISCTVGTSVPYGSHAPRSRTQRVVADDATPDDDAAPRRSSRLSCVRDKAGNDFGSAARIGKGTLRGCIDGATSIDVYALTAGASKGGTLFGITLDAAEDVCAKLYDQDRKEATGADCVSNGSSPYLWAAVAPNTTIYVRLERLRTHELGPYQLQVTERAIADEEEPNNSWQTAVPLALGQSHRALLGDVLNATGTQKDLYKIKLARASKLDISVDPGSDDVQAEITIFDADRRKVHEAEAENRGATLREAAELPAGTYYVQVNEAGWGYAHGNGPAGSGSHGAEKPTGHFTKPYTVEVNVTGDSAKKKRVSKR